MKSAFKGYPPERLLFLDQQKLVPVPDLWKTPPSTNLGKLGASLQTATYHLLYSLGLARFRIRPIVEQIREWGAEKVMVIVHAETAVLYLVCFLLGSVPNVYLVIHDPPDRMAMQYSLPFRVLFKRYVKMFLGWALRRARAVGVASPSMMQEYRIHFGVPCESLLPGAPMEEITSGQPPLSGQFRLAFAGSAYAQDAWTTLLRTLSQQEWEIDGLSISIDYLGEPPSWFPEHPRIRVHGWKELPEVLAILAQAHACYLPYWLDSDFDESVRLCFPSKLGTYLAAGRAVFYHGPRRSSPMELFARYPAAVCCHVAEQDGVLESLKRLVDPDLNRELSTQAHLAAISEVNETAFRLRFHRFLEIPLQNDRDTYESR